MNSQNMLPRVLPRSKKPRKTHLREVLAQLDGTRLRCSVARAPKSTIVPGCNHCKLKVTRSVGGKLEISHLHKPLFVEKLELFVRNELRNVESYECDENCNHFLCGQQILDAELKVYKQVFGLLLNKLTTFRPLLTKIKHVYERCIEARDERVKLMEIIAQKLEGFKKSVENQIETIKRRGATELYVLKTENNDLARIVSKLREDLRQSNERIDILRRELSESEEREIGKLVTPQTSMLAFTNVETKANKGNENRGSSILSIISTAENHSVDDLLIEDPVLLSVCLQRARKDLSNAHRRITELEETFRDVVPKRDLERLENRYQTFERQYDALSHEFETLGKENEILRANFDLVKEQKNNLRDRCKILAHTNTPRPDWSKCGQYIQGGVQRWRDITAKKSSEDRLTILLSELCGAACAENEYFVGQGTDHSVPVFLRYKGKVKNRKLGRREVSIVINDIWKNKVFSDIYTPMGDYILKYFTERYHMPLLRYEWIYNLYNACQRLVYDSQIGLFWDILWGNASEEGYHVLRKEFAFAKKMMDMRMEDKKINALLSEDLIEIMDSIYPYKSNQDIENIVYAAAKQLGIDPSTEAFDVAKLFAQNDEGWERGEFAREIIRQTGQEITNFGKSVLRQIDVTDKNTEVTVEVLRQGFTEIDVGISQSLLTQHMKWIYKVQDLSKAKPMSSSGILRQMRNGFIRRSHPEKYRRE